MSDNGNNNGHSNGNGSRRNLGQRRRTGGPKTPEGRAIALANLRPQRSDEPSRNPKGRPSAGLSILEWWNQMQGWSRKRLQSVIDDESEPVNKVAAARTWLGACEQQTGSSVDRICDRTGAYPKAGMDHTSNGESMVKVIRGVSMDDL